MDRLNKCNVPIYTAAATPQIHRHVVYPRRSVIEMLSTHGEADFLTSSIAFMMALAICQKDITEIALYGCDMSATSEYAYQRPGMLYLVGIARGRGIKVHVPEQSSLLKANFTYGDVAGYSTSQAKGLTEKLLVTRIASYQTDRAATHERMMKELGRIQTLDGCMQELEGLLEMVRHYNRGGTIPNA